MAKILICSSPLRKNAGNTERCARMNGRKEIRDEFTGERVNKKKSSKGSLLGTVCREQDVRCGSYSE